MADSGSGKGSGYNSTVPDAPGAESHPLTKALGEKISNYVDQYVDAMEKASDYSGIYYTFCHTFSSLKLFRKSFC